MMGAQHAEAVDVRAYDLHPPDAGDYLDWPQSLTAADTPLRDVLAPLETLGIVIVVDAAQRLLGTVTDADVRRGLLRAASLDDPVRAFMNRTPATISPARASREALHRDPSGAPLPVVDEQRRVVGLRSFAAPSLADRLVVVMAGGFGRRLRPLTDRCPKPLVRIGGRPLLELTLESLRRHGFSRFVFCVGYRAGMIQRHFGDGHRFGVHIEYLREGGRLGTAGPLGLLEQIPSAALLVINGDILTGADFSQLMSFHESSRADATMCVCEVGMQVPYGVVSVAGDRVESIREKPVQRCLVNAGIYVLEPRVLEALPRDRRVDMPEFLKTLGQRGDRIAAFPLYEQWMDIGNPADLANARTAMDLGRGSRVIPPGRASRQARTDAGQTVEFVLDDL